MTLFKLQAYLLLLFVAFALVPCASGNDATLHDLIARGDVLTVKTLEPSAKDLNQLDDSGRTPLHVAMETKQLTSFIFLLLKGADPALPDSNGETIHEVARRTMDDSYMRILSAHGSDLTTLESQLERRLHLAILRNDLVQVGVRLLKGEGVHARDPERQWTPLHVATINSSHKLMELFIALGADVNARDSIGQMPLHFAAEAGDVVALRSLIGAGADINAEVKSNGATALQMAVLSADTESVRLLLESGADPNSSDMRGWSAIHIAALKDLDEIGTLLIESGADIHALTLQGYTARLIATASENRGILLLLNGME